MPWGSGGPIQITPSRRGAWPPVRLTPFESGRYYSQKALSGQRRKPQERFLFYSTSAT